MLKIVEKIDDVVEEWTEHNISYHTFRDLCEYYVCTFLTHSKYEHNTTVELKLYNKDKLLLIFSLTKP